MYFAGKTLDDLLWKIFPKLLASTNHISPSRGNANELVGVHLKLGNPRARLSRSETRGKPFSCLGELLWYLSHGNRLDFIRYYIPAYDGESEDGDLSPLISSRFE
jgi:thymidylate synthase